MANTPFSNSSRLNCWASGASPSMTGVMGVSLTPVSKPSFFISALKYLALSHSLSTSSVDDFQQIDGGDAGRRIRRGDGRREQERAAALAQPFDDDLVAGHQPADHAEGLGERADLDIHLAVQAEVVHDAAPALAEHAFAVGVVHHEHDVVLAGDLVQRRQRRDVAVHAEDAVGDDQRAAVRACVFLDGRLQGGRHRCARRPRCVAPDSRQPSMMEAWFSRSEKITSSLPTSAGIVPRLAVKPDWKVMTSSAPLNFARRFSSSRCRSVVPAMVRTAAGPTPYFVGGLLGGLHELRMVCQPEIVVRAEVEHILAIHHQPCALRRADGADAVIQALLFQAVDLLREPIEFGHAFLLCLGVFPL